MASRDIFEVPQSARLLAAGGRVAEGRPRSFPKIPLYSWNKDEAVRSDQVVRDGIVHVFVFIKLHCGLDVTETLTKVRIESESSYKKGRPWIIIGVTSDWYLGGKLVHAARDIVPGVEVLHMIPTMEGTKEVNQLLTDVENGDSMVFVIVSESKEIICTTEHFRIAGAVAEFHVSTNTPFTEHKVFATAMTSSSNPRPVLAADDKCSARKKQKTQPLQYEASTGASSNRNGLSNKVAEGIVRELGLLQTEESEFAGDIIATIASWKRTHDKGDPTKAQVVATSKYLCEKTMMQKACQLREGGLLEDYRGRTTLKLTRHGCAQAAKYPHATLLNQKQIHAKMSGKGLADPVAKCIYELLQNGCTMSEAAIKLELEIQDVDWEAALKELQNRKYICEVQTVLAGHYWRLSDLVFPYGRPCSSQDVSG